jgi:hypothetical protein
MGASTRQGAQAANQKLSTVTWPWNASAVTAVPSKRVPLTWQPGGLAVRDGEFRHRTVAGHVVLVVAGLGLLG